MDKQKCPDCNNNNLDFIGKIHISRNQRKLLVDNYKEAGAEHLYPFGTPYLQKI